LKKGRKVMSEERERVEKLVDRIDELLVILNRVAEDLREVSASLKSLAVSQLASSTPTPIPPTPVAYAETQTMEDIKMMFPEDLEDLLGFEEKEDYIVVKPRQFLGSENFAKIASIVRGVGGEYISAGKASHFRVPTKKG
jgi:hypothetical protein